MVKRKEISQDIRNQAIGLLKGNYSLKSISQILDIPKSTIQYIVSRWKLYGNTDNCLRSGRPRKLQQRGLRTLKRTVKKNRWNSLKLITSEFKETLQTDISSKTVRRRLKDIGFRSCIPAKKPLISERNRKKRLSFYNTYKSFSNYDWKLVTWSDESRFNLFHSDGKMKVWRQSNERFNKDCILKTIQGSGGSILIWACFY